MAETSCTRFSKPLRLAPGNVADMSLLRIVDHDQVEPACVLLEAAHFGTHFRNGGTGGVINEDARVHQLAQGGLQLLLLDASKNPFWIFC